MRKISTFTLVCMVLMLSIVPARGSDRSTDTDMTIWATVGPLGYLNGAHVVVRNASKKLIGHGVTNRRGVALIKRMNPRKIKYPLSIYASGGKAFGKKFKGRLAAEASSVGLSSNVVFLDLISTAAKSLSGPSLPFDMALQLVRKSLGIGYALPNNVIRVNNPFVRLDELELAEKLYGGFNAVVNKVASAAKLGVPYYWMGNNRPKTNALHAGEVVLASDQSNTSASTCSAAAVGVPPGSQPNVIEEYSTILMEELGAKLGAATAVGRALIPGMIFGEKSPNSDVLTELETVQKQLDCIDQKINYLSAQVSALQVQLSLQDADYCKNSQISPKWDQYEAYINATEGYDAISVNLLFESFAEVGATCGAVIDKGLFQIPSGASESAWQTTFKNAQNKWGGFLFPADNQGLQVFLQDWSYFTYKYFVLNSEYYNYKGAYSLAASYGGYDEADSNYCSPSTNSSSTTFCVWDNNIKKALPPTIYSDEAAIIRTGIAVNAVPGVAPTGDLLSAWYLYKHPEGMEWGVYYAPTNFSLFNSKELNTSDVNSAIESYESPRVYRDRYIYSSDITELANKSSDVASFFLDAITNKNYVQNSVWNGLTSSQVSFGSANAFGRVIYDQEDYSTGLDWVTIKFNAGAEINNIVSTLCVDMDGDFYVYCGYPQTTYPNLGILLGRAWWSDSAKASTFFPPNPQCYEKAVPAGVVCD